MLSDAEKAACLEVLYRGLVEIRSAAGAGESERTRIIADALHNLPHFIAGVVDRDCTLKEFEKHRFARMTHQYPDLAFLLEPLRDV